MRSHTRAIQTAAGALLALGAALASGCAAGPGPGASLEDLAQRQLSSPHAAAVSAPPPPGVDRALLEPLADDDPIAWLPLDAVLAIVTTDAQATGVLRERDATPPPDDAVRDRALRLYTSGRSKRLAGDAAGAVQDLQQAVELDATAPEPWRELALAHLALGDRLSGVAAYRELLARDPDHTLALHQVGLASLERRNYDTAAAHLARAADLLEDEDPALPFLVHRALGRALMELGYVAAAADALLRSARLPENFTSPTALASDLAEHYRARGDLWLEIGDAAIRLQRYEDALRAYAIADAFPTFNPGALTPRRVYAAMRLGRPADAARVVVEDLAQLRGRADARHFRLIEYICAHSAVDSALASELESLEAAIPDDERRFVAPKLARARAAALPLDDALRLLRDRLAADPAEEDAIEAFFARLASAGHSRLALETARLIEAAPLQSGRYTDALLRADPDAGSLHDAAARLSAPRVQPPAAGLLVARLALELGRFDDAERAARDILEQDPAFRTAGASLLGETLLRAGRADDAREALDLLEASQEPDALYARAMLLRAMGRYDAALRVIAPLIDPTRDEPPAPADLFLAAQLSLPAERFDDAEHYYRLAIGVDPAFEAAHAGLIALYTPTGPLANRAELAEAMRRLREIAPSSRTIRWMRAQDLVTAAQYDEAERELLALAEEHATDSIASLLTTLWLRTGSADRAEQWLRDKAARHPGDPVFREQLGRVLASTDRAEEGAELLRRWLDDRPSDTNISRQLESILRDRLNRADEADRIAMARLLRTPSSVARSLELSQILINRLDFPVATATLREALALGDPLRDREQAALLEAATAIGRNAANTGHDIDNAAALVEELAARVDALTGTLHGVRLSLLVNSNAPNETVMQALRRAQSEQPPMAADLYAWTARRLDEYDRVHEALAVIEQGASDIAEPSNAMLGLWLQLAYKAQDPDAAVRAIDTARIQGTVNQFVTEGVNIVGRAMTRDEAAAELAFQFAQWFSYNERRDDAEDLYRLALRFRPRHPMANNNLAYAWVDRGERLDEAHDMLAIAYEEMPNDGAITDSLGWVRYKLGVLEDIVDDNGEVITPGAISLLRKASEFEEGRNDPIVHDHLGDALWRAGRHEDAIERWTVAAALITTMPAQERATRPDLTPLQRVLRAKIDAAEAGQEPGIAPQGAHADNQPDHDPQGASH